MLGHLLGHVSEYKLEIRDGIKQCTASAILWIVILKMTHIIHDS